MFNYLMTKAKENKLHNSVGPIANWLECKMTRKQPQSISSLHDIHPGNHVRLNPTCGPFSF